jgi:DNA-binding NtrC family response regulator
VDLLIVQGDVARAVETARRLCAAVTAFPAAAVAASLLGHARLLSLDLDPAEAVLAGAAAEAALLEQPVPERLACAWRDVCVWRGRFEEAIAVARMAPGHAPADVGGAALAAWAVRDGDLLRTCRARLEQAAAAGEPHARFWAAIAGALALAVAEPAELAALAPRAAEALARAAPRGGRALAHAVAIEVLLRAGADPRRHRAAAGAAPLHALLSDWMTACAAGDDAAMARTAARARHAGVDGLTRWGTREPRMQLVHDWPTLLHLIHDADDELGALTSGCAWVRRQGRATAVAVVDAAGTSWLASDGWTRDDLARPDVQRLLAAPPPATMADGAALFASASIRYAGRTIGRVLARGTVDGRATLEQAVAAFAAVASPAVRARLDTLAVGRAAHVLLPDIIGQSAAVSALRDEIARAASTIFPVLIEGESGTGKELVARALHRLGPRRDRRFCAVNCAAFTDELFEAELFGYARGAFTGAVGARAGLIEDAHEGTLFLDEVGDLSARAQAKLLRTLQEREIRRLGENAARAVDVRVVAATNVPLADAVGQGRFRADLLFRLAVVRIRVPPLRDRAEDIPLIARAVWRRLSDEAGKRVALGPDAIAALCRHRWPGNIRELQNVLAALVVLAPGRGRVGGRHVSQVLQSEAPADEAAGLSLDDGRRLFERRMIVAALARHGGRRAPAAHELGLTRQGLAKAMRRLDLDLAGDQAGVA